MALVGNSEIMTYTILYIVGGHSNNYQNLYKSIKFLLKNNCNYKIQVLEIGNQLTSTLNYSVINGQNLINIEQGKKQGFKFWKMKYYACLKCETEYGIYIDSDMFMINNNLDDILNKIKKNIGVSQHFYVPTFSDFEQKSVPIQNRKEFGEVKNILNFKPTDKFFTGGIIPFYNSEQNKKIFQDVLDIYDNIYSEGKEYIQGITDELFYSHLLNIYKNYTILNGAVNCCGMGNEYMPIKLENNMLYSRNSYENEWQLITFLHFDPFRRNPLPWQCYDNKVNRKLFDEFNI